MRFDCINIYEFTSVVSVIQHAARMRDFILLSLSLFGSTIHRVIHNDCRGHAQYTPDATTCDFVLWGYVKDQV